MNYQIQENIVLTTTDEQTLTGIFYHNITSKKGLLLIHQLAKNKDSWQPWINEFQKTHNVISLDLRGHGQSSGDFRDFSDDDFNAMKKDVAAAVEYFEKKGITKNQISFMGASIGANTIQNYISVNPHNASILLSPGTNYRGIKLTLKDNSSLVIVSKEDSYSCDSVKELEKISPTSKFIFLENKGHGTNMLDESLVKEIITFLNS
ncbi:MAG: alpha/beta fold hydrolase [Candidatus Woesearchaeota archaeon]|jgi:alpha/beta superfamily hydrolase